jgi:hypothetical protein
MIAASRTSLYKKSFHLTTSEKHLAQTLKTKPGAERRFVIQRKMSEAKEFPPQKVRAIVAEVAALLKEKKESVSVAETVCVRFFFSYFVTHLVLARS